MIIELNEKTYLMGDSHGKFDCLKAKIATGTLQNCDLFSVGDNAVGFKRNQIWKTASAELEIILNDYNINLYMIRGNHDDPSYFKSFPVSGGSRIKFVPDYTQFVHNNRSILAIGGAISIDRALRVEGHRYWKDERLVFDKSKCSKCDILITHTAPTDAGTGPSSKKYNQIQQAIRYDGILRKDLKHEKDTLDEIMKLCSPSFHFCGHFHVSETFHLGTCCSRTINIDELVEL